MLGLKAALDQLLNKSQKANVSGLVSKLQLLVARGSVAKGQKEETWEAVASPLQ